MSRKIAFPEFVKMDDFRFEEEKEMFKISLISDNTLR